MEPTDEALMLAVGRGDLDQLGTLFERHHPTLFQFFCRVTGRRSVSEDLVQDVFFRMLKYRRTFHNRSSFRAWMFLIARNARVDYFKKRARVPEEPESGNDPPSPDPFPSEQLEQAEDVALLELALSELSRDKRELLALARFQELRYDEIAELLGVNVGTVKVRVHRAVRDLRNAFEKLSGRKTSCTVNSSETSLRTM